MGNSTVDVRTAEQILSEHGLSVTRSDKDKRLRSSVQTASFADVCAQVLQVASPPLHSRLSNAICASERLKSGVCVWRGNMWRFRMHASSPRGSTESRLSWLSGAMRECDCGGLSVDGDFAAAVRAMFLADASVEHQAAPRRDGSDFDRHCSEALRVIRANRAWRRGRARWLEAHFQDDTFDSLLLAEDTVFRAPSDDVRSRDSESDAEAALTDDDSDFASSDDEAGADHCDESDEGERSESDADGGEMHAFIVPDPDDEYECEFGGFDCFHGAYDAVCRHEATCALAASSSDAEHALASRVEKGSFVID